MFKKIYIEITNRCNLQCSFCNINHTNRVKKEMDFHEFEYVMKEIDNYTDYIYLHILGEPLMHRNLSKILFIASKYNKKVNITTNGTLLMNNINLIMNYKDVIRQINVSMHARMDDINYLDNIIKFINIISDTKIIISLRLWNLNNKVDNNIDVYNYLRDQLYLDDNKYDELLNRKSIKLSHNLYLNKAGVFTWPNMDNDYYSECGKCYGTIDHIGILSDGTVVPCCLDSDGIINLGNIFNNNFKSIIESSRFMEMQDGFRKNVKCEELCKKCNFISLGE